MKTIDMKKSGLSQEQIARALAGKPFTLRGLSLELPGGAADTAETIAADHAAVAAAESSPRAASTAITVEDLVRVLVARGVIKEADLAAAVRP